MQSQYPDNGSKSVPWPCTFLESLHLWPDLVIEIMFYEAFLLYLHYFCQPLTCPFHVFVSPVCQIMFLYFIQGYKFILYFQPSLTCTFSILCVSYLICHIFLMEVNFDLLIHILRLMRAEPELTCLSAYADISFLNGVCLFILNTTSVPSWQGIERK